MNFNSDHHLYVLRRCSAFTSPYIHCSSLIVTPSFCLHLTQFVHIFNRLPWMASDRESSTGRLFTISINACCPRILSSSTSPCKWSTISSTFSEIELRRKCASPTRHQVLSGRLWLCLRNFLTFQVLDTCLHWYVPSDHAFFAAISITWILTTFCVLPNTPRRVLH
jgi:hypothetical protein